MKLSELFEHLGRYSAKYPFIAIAACLLITGLCSIGLLHIKIESDPQNLWVDPDGRTFKEQTKFSELFGKFFRVNQMILKSTDENSDFDLFNKDTLEILYKIQDHFRYDEATYNGANYSINDLCYKPLQDGGCMLVTPLGYWKNDFDLLKNDPDVKRTAQCVDSYVGDPQPCLDENSIPVQRQAVVGGLKCLGNSSDTCAPCAPTAKSLIITLLLLKNDSSSDLAAQWEKDVFIKTIHEFNNGSLLSMNGQNLTITYMAERGLNDELKEETTSQAAVVVISYFAMFIYVACAIGSFPNKVHSGFFIGLSGILIVICSVICAVGVMSLLGFSLSMISSEVVPFLILAIGVDNMFIIANAHARTDTKDSIDKRLGLALREVGPSITSAACCEMLAFAVGILTKAPALVVFCLMATIAVGFDYLFQITAFVGVLSLNERRKEDNRLDMLCCIQTGTAEGPRRDLIRHFMENFYTKFLFHPATKIATFTIFIWLFIISIIGMQRMTLGLNQEVTVMSDSDLYKYFVDQNKYLEVGAIAYVVFNNVNYTNPDEVKVLTTMSDGLSQLNQSVVPPIYSWLKTFNQYTSTTPQTQWMDDCDTRNISNYNFTEQMHRFLKSKVNSPCCKVWGICGEPYASDISFDSKSGEIVATRFRFSHAPFHKQTDYINAFISTRAVVDHYSTLFNNTADAPQKGAFAYSLFYVFFDQYIFIRGLAVQNILVAIGVVFTAVLILRNMMAAVLAMICVFGVAFNMIGLAYVLNWIVDGYVTEINAVSVVNLVMATGLSVEFCIHIILAFQKSSGTSVERSKNAISVMGSSILVGIITTKCVGVSVLAFARSTLFRLYYFRMYMSLIGLGFFYGLLFLPICLSLLKSDKKKKVGQHPYGEERLVNNESMTSNNEGKLN